MENVGVEYTGSTSPAREGDVMPDVTYFPNVELNFAENMLKHGAPGSPLVDEEAIVSVSEARDDKRWTFGELRGGNLSLVSSRDLVSWRDEGVILATRSGHWDNATLSTGPSPVRLSDGNWLLFYDIDNLWPVCTKQCCSSRRRTADRVPRTRLVC